MEFSHRRDGQPRELRQLLSVLILASIGIGLVHDRDPKAIVAQGAPVVLHAEPDYKGRSLGVGPGIHDLEAETSFSDRSRSISIAPGFRVILCQGQRASGRCEEASASAPELSPHLDGQISYLHVLEAARPKRPPWPFFLLDFEMPGDEASRAEAAASIGYSGISFVRTTHSTSVQALEAYRRSPAVKAGRLDLPAVLVSARYSSENLNSLEPLLQTMRESDNLLWVIFKEEEVPDRQALVTRIQHLAERSAELGIRLTLYPHYGTAIESGEEALALIQATGRDDIGTTIHLTHELRAGNRHRLSEVIQRLQPYADLAVIAGADADPLTASEEPGNWDDAIQPLYESDLLLLDFLEPLADSGYEGWVGFLTFGIKGDARETVLEKRAASHDSWRALSAAIQDSHPYLGSDGNRIWLPSLQPHPQ